MAEPIRKAERGVLKGGSHEQKFSIEGSFIPKEHFEMSGDIFVCHWDPVDRNLE